MQNIFPIAQKAVIEETIGITRPSAYPPADQGTKESVLEIKKATRRNHMPSWFSQTELSEKEKNMIKGIHSSYFKNQEKREFEYFALREQILKSYEATGEYLPLQFVMKTSNYLLATIAFNFLEDNKIINYNIDLLETIDSLDQIIEETHDNESKENEHLSSSDYVNANRTVDDAKEQSNNTLQATNNVNQEHMNNNRTMNEHNQVPSDSEYSPSTYKTIDNDLNKLKSEIPIKILKNEPQKLINNFYESRETRKIKEKYFKKEMLEAAKCSCGTNALYFTSDLLFICESCFLANKFPSRYSSRNFHKLTKELLNSIWTKEEEFKLLKNIEMYGDAWDRVSEGLNKTFEQCIFHFIKMPIIENVTHYPSIPFTQIPNSISTLIAFTCSLVYPSISTELSKVALQNINDPDLMYILLETAHKKGLEVLEMEKGKIDKLEKVELEALLKLMMLKIESISEMHAEIQAVKTELEDERERLLEEFTKLK